MSRRDLINLLHVVLKEPYPGTVRALAKDLKLPASKVYDALRAIREPAFIEANRWTIPRVGRGNQFGTLQVAGDLTGAMIARYGVMHTMDDIRAAIERANANVDLLREWVPTTPNERRIKLFTINTIRAYALSEFSYADEMGYGEAA